jgi:hypothetical protein
MAGELQLMDLDDAQLGTRPSCLRSASVVCSAPQLTATAVPASTTSRTASSLVSSSASTRATAA